jgi:hypothetical protein
MSPAAGARTYTRVKTLDFQGRAFLQYIAAQAEVVHPLSGRVQTPATKRTQEAHETKGASIFGGAFLRRSFLSSGPAKCASRFQFKI